MLKGRNRSSFGGILLFIVGAWHLKDGWFPSEAVLVKHAEPGDSFYAYNKIVAVVTLVASAICGYVHKVVK